MGNVFTAKSSEVKPGMKKTAQDIKKEQYSQSKEDWSRGAFVSKVQTPDEGRQDREFYLKYKDWIRQGLQQKT